MLGEVAAPSFSGEEVAYLVPQVQLAQWLWTDLASVHSKGFFVLCRPFCLVIGAVGGIVFDSVLVLAVMAALSTGYDMVQHQLKKGISNLHSMLSVLLALTHD